MSNPLARPALRAYLFGRVQRLSIVLFMRKTVYIANEIKGIKPKMIENEP